MTIFIYCLSDPRDGKIRYVGKAKNLRKRFLSHLWEQKRTDRKTNWVKNLKRSGVIPSVDILETIENSNDEDWQECERFWISYLRFLGCDLTNLESGGRGGTVPHADTIAKRVAKTTGQKRSADAKLKMRIAKLGKKASAETCEKHRAAILGKKRAPYSEQARKNMGLARLGKRRGPQSEIHKARIGAKNAHVSNCKNLLKLAHAYEPFSLN